MELCVSIIQEDVCYLITFLRRDANRGGCSQSCRWYYDIFEKDQQLNHDEIVPFSMSSKDMSLVDELPKLIELGVDSLKSKEE